MLTDNWHIDVVSGCHQTFRAPEAVTGVGAMPAPHADGGGMGADVPNPGEWESWAREAETLWAAVSARKPRLEVASGSGRAGRESARGGRDADGVPETHAAWPAAQLFTPGTIVTPAERADVAFAASTAPPASRGPTASVPGWRSDAALTFCGNTGNTGNTDVSAFDSVSRAAAAADLRRRRESRPAAAARRAWRDVERAYLRTVRGDGPLAGTPLALRGADAARIALTREKKNQKQIERVGSEICPAIVHDQSPGSIDLLNDLLNALPFPNDVVSRAFRLWRVRCRSINRARSFAKQRRFKRLRLSLRAWRDDAFRERTRKVALKAIAFETWLGRVIARRAVDAATASAAARATRRGATGAWRVWRAVADVAAEKKESAVFFNHAKRANDALIRWRKKTDTCRRNRAWCAFAETWRARRALTRTVSLWRQCVSRLLAARDAAEARRRERARVRHATVFFLWRRRASTVAAGVELVRLACVKWRFEKMERAFGAFRSSASAKRAKRLASTAFYETKALAKATARWRERVVQLEHHRFGDAAAAMRRAVNKTRLTKRIDAWRLAVFRGRERDREAAEAHRARTRRVFFRGWVDVTESAIFLTDQLLAETERLGWPDRVRARRAFVTWRERATRRAAYRESVEAEIVVLASLNRARRCVARWRLNAAEKTLLKIQERRAKHHRDSFLFKVYKTEISRRVQTRLATQKKLGVSATRRLALCHAGWRAFCDEMRPMRRRLRRYRETTRAGHVVVARALEDSTMYTKGRKQARSRLGGDEKNVNVRDGVEAALRRETRDARDAATVGPLVAAAARARVSALLRSMRARWRANDADAEQTRRRLGKVWSDAVARTTAVAFVFPGFSGSGVSGAELERTLERTASGKTFPGKPPLRDDRFEKQTTERASASTTPGGSPARGERAATPRAPPARRPGPGGGGGAIRFFSRRGNQAESSASSPTTRPESVFFSPDPSPSRASDGFRSARSSMPSSANASRAPSAAASPAKAPTARRGRDETRPAEDAPSLGATAAEEALRVLRERVAAGLAASAETSSSVSWSPSPARRRDERADADGAVSPDRRRNSSAMLEMRARFDTK